MFKITAKEPLRQVLFVTQLRWYAIGMLLHD